MGKKKIASQVKMGGGDEERIRTAGSKEGRPTTLGWFCLLVAFFFFLLELVLAGAGWCWLGRDPGSATGPPLLSLRGVGVGGSGRIGLAADYVAIVYFDFSFLSGARSY